MRRPHRNIEIFSMSVLDMFASALGAFIMCAVILFPYYNKDVSKELSAAAASLDGIKKDLSKTLDRSRAIEEQVRRQETEVQRARQETAQLNQCRQDVAACQAELGKTFLLVQIEWSTGLDVNLHVIDPRGNEFSWIKPNRAGRDYPNSQARLSIDVATAPGIEVWLDPAATPGEYHVDYVIPRNPDRDVVVTGAVFDRSGKKILPPRTLRVGQLRVRAATIQIANDGTATLR